MQRRRDRYECVLENYPPLDEPTILADIAAEFLRAVNIAFSAFNISGTIREREKGRRTEGGGEGDGGVEG